MRTRRMVVGVAVVMFSGIASAQPLGVIPGVRAHLKPVAYQIPVGHPVEMLFSIENTTDDPITLTVRGAEPDLPAPEMGLPLAHILGADKGTCVSVTTSTGRKCSANGYRVPAEAPILMVAPHSTVGTTIDVRDYFPTLRSAGQFRITWSPYRGAVEPASVVVSLAPRQQVQLVTEDGTMTINLFYEDAPHHVENFLELAQNGFYNNKPFHRLEPGYMLQGGCPRGDGTGIRPDGKRVLAEFNSHRHDKGTVSMALLDDDPDSASCQFFICNTRMKEWDGRYTVFGELEGEESFETLDRLMSVPTDESGRPLRKLSIRTARIIEAPTDLPVEP